MNFSDTRPGREWRRLQLLIRLMEHEARTSTIAAWTGLSENRVRALVHEYGTAPGERRPLRHRGQPPHQVSYFFRSLRIHAHAAVLGSIYELLSLLPRDGRPIPPHQFPSVGRGEVLCEAYEVYRASQPTPLIRFEHAVLLATALAHGEEISLQTCPECEAQMLVDHFAIPQVWCTYCRPSATLPAIPGQRATPAIGERPSHHPRVQLPLFNSPPDGLQPAPGLRPAPGPQPTAATHPGPETHPTESGQPALT